MRIGPALTCASVARGLEVSLVVFLIVARFPVRRRRQLFRGSGPAMVAAASVPSDFQFVEKLAGVGIDAIPKFAVVVNSKKSVVREFLRTVVELEARPVAGGRNRK